MNTTIKAIITGIGLILAISVAGCPKPIPNPNPPGPDATDATPAPIVDAAPAPAPDDAGIDARKYTCTTVCTNLKKRHCPGANDTVKGSTCVDVCVNTQASGIVTWDLKCRSTKTTCPAIDSCP